VLKYDPKLTQACKTANPLASSETTGILRLEGYKYTQIEIYRNSAAGLTIIHILLVVEQVNYR